jgi:hypothetical protein
LFLFENFYLLFLEDFTVKLWKNLFFAFVFLKINYIDIVILLIYYDSYMNMYLYWQLFYFYCHGAACELNSCQAVKRCWHRLFLHYKSFFSCSLFTDTVSNSRLYRVKGLYDSEWWIEECRRKWSWPNSRYYLGMCLKGLRKTMKILSREPVSWPRFKLDTSGIHVRSVTN